MESEQITVEQAEELGKALYPVLNYLARLRDRADKRLLPTDKLYKLINEAYDKVHSLNVHVHYLSCKSGVGMGQRE